MKVEIVGIEKLNPDPANARRHSKRNVEEIARSLKAFGQHAPLVVQKSTMRVLVGNGRLEAMKSLGWKQAAVYIVDDDNVTAVRRALADNRTAELAEWDEAALAGLMANVEDIPGWNADELDEFLKKSNGAPTSDADAEPQVDRADELAKKWGVKTGDLWELGEHRIICGDSTDEATVRRVMSDDRATLVFTDPPYGVNIGAKNRMLNKIQKSGLILSDIESDTISCDGLYKLLLKCFTLTKKFCADDCAVFVCSPQGGELGMMMMMMQDAGLKIRHVLNWAKNCATFSMGRLDYDYQHEPILYTWVKTHKRNKAGAFQTSLWTVDKPRASKEHPTMKPVELPENAILNHTDAGDIVYEPFSGSGTDIIACERTGRRCRAVELMPGYVAVALQRWADATGKTPKRIGGK